MQLRKCCSLFALGGSLYVGLELLWRGRSHSSMFLAGGLCFVIIGELNRAKPRRPAVLRMLTGAGIITAVELAVGLAANRDYSIWDYRQQWGNLLGQICPLFSLLWMPLTLAAEWVYWQADRQLAARLPLSAPQKMEE